MAPFMMYGSAESNLRMATIFLPPVLCLTRLVVDFSGCVELSIAQYSVASRRGPIRPCIQWQASQRDLE